jgi:hypothetical protein
MPMAPPTAHFASLRAELVVVEAPAEPIYIGGRQVGVKPGRYHRFHGHRCEVSGQKAIDFLRARINAPDALEAWELDASDVPEVTALLAELAVADIDRVRDILAAERQTSGRHVVLETCERILQRAGVSERKIGQKEPVVG